MPCGTELVLHGGSVLASKRLTYDKVLIRPQITEAIFPAPTSNPEIDFSL